MGRITINVPGNDVGPWLHFQDKKDDLIAAVIESIKDCPNAVLGWDFPEEEDVVVKVKGKHLNDLNKAYKWKQEAIREAHKQEQAKAERKAAREAKKLAKAK